MSAEVMDAIRVFYPLSDTRESLDKVVLEWLDFKATNLWEKVMAFIPVKDTYLCIFYPIKTGV